MMRKIILFLFVAFLFNQLSWSQSFYVKLNVSATPQMASTTVAKPNGGGSIDEYSTLKVSVGGFEITTNNAHGSVYTLSPTPTVQTLDKSKFPLQGTVVDGKYHHEITYTPNLPTVVNVYSFSVFTDNVSLPLSNSSSYTSSNGNVTLSLSIQEFYAIATGTNTIACNCNNDKVNVYVNGHNISGSVTLRVTRKDTPTRYVDLIKSVTQTSAKELVEIAYTELPTDFYNTELQIRVVYPDGTLSPAAPLNNYFFLSTPTPTVSAITQPTCYERNDASFTLNFPSLPGQGSTSTFNYLFTLSRYSNLDNPNSSGKTISYDAGSGVQQYRFADGFTVNLPLGIGVSSVLINNDFISTISGTINDPINGLKLKQGVYSVEVKYNTESSAANKNIANLCTTVPYVFMIQVPEPLNLQLQPVIVSGIYHTTVIGGTGSVKATVSGGKAGCTYFYKINSGPLNSIISGATIGGLHNGDEIILSNSDGCASVSQKVVFNQPPTLTVQLVSSASNSPTCHSNNSAINAVQYPQCHNDGKITFTPSGGVGPSYSAKLQIQTGVNIWADVQGKTLSGLAAASTSFTGLSQGVYRVIVSDGYSSASPSSPASLDLTPSEIVATQPADLALKCFNAPAIVQIPNTNNYTLNLFNGSTPISPFTNNVTTVGAGTYTVNYVSGQCYISKSFKVTQPNSVFAVSAVSPTSPDICGKSTGSVTLNLSGGYVGNEYPYYIEITNGTITRSIKIDSGSVSGIPFGALPAGTYSVIAYSLFASKNSFNCSATTSFAIIDSQPLSTVGYSVLQDESCVERKDAKIQLTNFIGIVDSYNFSGAEANVPNSSGVLSGLSSGVVYNLNITETVRGCTKTIKIPVGAIKVNPNALAFSGSSTIVPSSCPGINNAAIDFAASSAFNLTSYSLLKGGVTILSSPSTGSFKNFTGSTTVDDFTLKVTDAAGCEISKRETIGVNNNPVSFIATAVNTPCQEIDKGQIQITGITKEANTTISVSLYKGSSLTALQSYSNLEFTTCSFSDLPKDNYRVVVEDNNKCNSIKYPVVGENGKRPTITISNTELLACPAASNGAIEVTATSGTSQASELVFDFSGAQPNKIAIKKPSTSNTYQYSKLNGNSYTVKVTEANGCYNSKSDIVPVTTNLLTITGLTPTPSSCLTSNNGVIAYSATGGKKFSYGYDFDITGKTSPTQRGLSATFSMLPIGTYTVWAKDSEGCIASLSNSNTVITQVPIANQYSVTSVVPTSPTCEGYENGELQLATANSKSNLLYTYQLSDTKSSKVYSGSVASVSNPKISNFKAGSYNLLITSSENCSSSFDGVSITDHTPITVSTEVVKVKDKGMSTGVVIAQIQGGSSYYDYELRNASNAVINSNIKSTSLLDSIKNLSAGIYQFRLKDNFGCKYFKDAQLAKTEWYSGFIEVLEPASALSLEVRKTDVSCNKFDNGTIKLAASGGWLDEINGYSFSFDNGVNWSGNDSVFNLKPAIYNVQLQDKEGVRRIASVQITQPDTLNFIINTTKNATCSAKNNGLVVATPINFGSRFSDGLHFYIHSTTDNSGLLGAKSVDVGSYSFGELLKDKYRLWVEDKNGCKASKPFDITAPEAVQIDVKYNYIHAKGTATGDIVATISNGNHYYEYRWIKDGATLPFESGFTTGDLHLQNLVAGDFLLQVKDTANCMYEGEEWMTRSIKMLEPASAIVVSVKSAKSVSCKGLSNGKVELEANGGWGDYRFRMNGGNYTTQSVYDNLPAGNYIFSVIDSTATENAITYTVEEPSLPLTASVHSVDGVKCNRGADGTIILDIKGGNGGYQVSTDYIVWATDTVARGLSANTYNVYIVDSKGCETKLGPVVVDQPEIVSEEASGTVIPANCTKDDGAINVSFIGGTGALNYSWQREKFLLDGTHPVVDLPELQTSSISNVASGRYYLTIKDANECPFHFTYVIGDLSDLSIDAIQVDSVSCFGYADGAASAVVIGNNPEFRYLWELDKAPTDSPTAHGYAAGVYRLLVGDAKGCNAIKEFTIPEPNAIQYQLVQEVQPICAGGAKGSIDLAAVGGSPNYYYSWSNGKTENAISQLDPANYTVTISDSHKCKASFDFAMSYQRLVNPNLGADVNLCHSNSLPLDAGNYANFSWSSTNGFTSSRRNVVLTDPGSYYLEVKDADNCMGYDTLAVNVSYLKIDKLITSDVTCAGFANGSASILVGPAGWGYSALWSNSRNGNAIDKLTKGNYSVTVSDNYGCSDTRSFKIDEPLALELTSHITEPLCLGVPNGKIALDAKGGKGTYSYNWLDGANTSSRSGLDLGHFELNITDDNGCSLNSIYDLGYRQSLYLDLGGNRTMCKNNHVKIYPGAYHKYTWYNDVLPIGVDSTLVVDSSANINLTVEDTNGCLASDNVQVLQSETSFSPLFLCASSVEVGDTLFVIEVSQPKPQAADWTFPLAHRIVEENGSTLKVIFDEVGSGEIKLSASSKVCQGETWKNIMVLPSTGGGGTEPGKHSVGSNFIALSATPNPSDGHFVVTVKFKEVAPVTFYLVDIGTGQIIDIRKLSGSKDYTQPFAFIGSGRLAVFAESGGERMVVKELVH